MKDTYFSILIFPFRFLWDKTLYQFACLPFGYSLAPTVFTKVLKPAMATLHCQGIRTITFIGDTRLIAATAEECFDDILTTINLFGKPWFSCKLWKVSYDS